MNQLGSILKGNNSIISAPTGSGKTEAFIIPILQKILENPIKGVFCITCVSTKCTN